MKKYLSLLLNSMLLAHGGLLSAQDESKESFTANLRKKVTRVFNYQTIKRSIMAPAMLKAVGVALVGLFAAAGGRRWTRRNSARKDGSAHASMNIEEKELHVLIPHVNVEPWEEGLLVEDNDPLFSLGPIDVERLKETLDNAHNQAKAEFDKVKKSKPQNELDVERLYLLPTLENAEDQETAKLAALVENIKLQDELGDGLPYLLPTIPSFSSLCGDNPFGFSAPKSKVPDANEEPDALVGLLESLLKGKELPEQKPIVQISKKLPKQEPVVQNSKKSRKKRPFILKGKDAQKAWQELQELNEQPQDSATNTVGDFAPEKNVEAWQALQEFLQKDDEKLTPEAIVPTSSMPVDYAGLLSAWIACNGKTLRIDAMLVQEAIKRWFFQLPEDEQNRFIIKTGGVRSFLWELMQG